MRNFLLFLFLCTICNLRMMAQYWEYDEYQQRYAIHVPQKNWAHFFLRSGINLDHMSARGFGGVGNLQFDSRLHSFYAAGMDMEMAHDSLFGIFFRIEVAYKPIEFNGQGYDPQSENIFNTYKLKEQIFTPELSILCKIPDRRKWTGYGGIGLGYNAAKLKHSIWQTQYGNEQPIVFKDYVELLDGTWSLNFAAGLLYRDRWELNCKLWLTDWSTTPDYDLVNRALTIAVGYRF